MMAYHSAQWIGFQSISATSTKYKQIKNMLESADFDYIKARAMALRKKDESTLQEHLDCSIDLSRFASGHKKVVFQLIFSDAVSWIVRIPFGKQYQDDETTMLCEIATMRLIKENANIPVPRVFDFQVSAKQPFHFPYMLMERLRGEPLTAELASRVPLQHRSKVAQQLAVIFSELRNLTFSTIGRPWCGENIDEPVQVLGGFRHDDPDSRDTSLSYFNEKLRAKTSQFLRQNPDNPDLLTACWLLKLSLTYGIIGDRVRGPFPLCHLDFTYNNLLFDDDYNLTGVIDWENAHAAPLEQLSICQEFMIFDGSHSKIRKAINELKYLVIGFIGEIEKAQTVKPPLDLPELDPRSISQLTSLSAYMTSSKAEIIQCFEMSKTRSSALVYGRLIADLIYGETVTWEQLREVHGNLPLN